MIDLRIGRHHWDLLDELQQADIKQMAEQYARDFGYDWDWEFFWLKFDEEQFFLMNLEHPHLLKYFRSVFDGTS